MYFIRYQSYTVLQLIYSVFLPAGDIPRFVALGSVALGITGQDMIAESTHADEITELLPLGFGKCKLQVQVPVQSPYQTIEELSGKRIATSFEVLAAELFKGVDERVSGQKDGKSGKTSVEYVGGSVEAACALGMADGIGELQNVRYR
jgi:ATP phosphoribosyltransferase